jgi:hypothetical protein
MTSVAAVQAYSKINAAGQWVDRSEHVDLNALFEKMTAPELGGPSCPQFLSVLKPVRTGGSPVRFHTTPTESG